MSVDSKKVLAIIPARGGSKRIPRKNSRLLAGKPLIGYTIEAARQCSLIDTIHVSTDDDAISQIAADYGLETSFMRPPEYAADNSPIIDTLTFVINNFALIGEKFDLIILLQPTSPFRTHRHISEALDLYRGPMDTITSVMPVHEPGYWQWEKDVKFIKPLCGVENMQKTRTQLPEFYIENGAIIITKTDTIARGSIYGSRVAPYVMSRDDSLDIDIESDWQVAEERLNNRI